VKISKKTRIFTALGALIIGCICLFMAFNQQTTQKADLLNKLTLAKQKLNTFNNDKLVAQKEQLNLQMAGYISQSAAIKTRLAYSDDSINITDVLFQQAADCQVAILEISSSGAAVENLGTVKAETMNISFKAQGTLETIADFVYSLKKIFPTGVVKSMSLDIIQPISTATPLLTTIPGDNNTTSLAPVEMATVVTVIPDTTIEPFGDTIVNINLVIYNYKGD